MLAAVHAYHRWHLKRHACIEPCGTPLTLLALLAALWHHDPGPVLPTPHLANHAPTCPSYLVLPAGARCLRGSSCAIRTSTGPWYSLRGAAITWHRHPWKLGPCLAVHLWWSGWWVGLLCTRMRPTMYHIDALLGVYEGNVVAPQDPCASPADVAS